ncbi:hypothetical protein BGZ60DRAFT_30937 [Tricladium varicosporioides]|nr:hypothetical protein BGZ60DRAFT_30937 [Hymenoscyphus varicosporioides]
MVRGTRRNPTSSPLRAGLPETTRKTSTTKAKTTRAKAKRAAADTHVDTSDAVILQPQSSVSRSQSIESEVQADPESRSTSPPTQNHYNTRSSRSVSPSHIQPLPVAKRAPRSTASAKRRGQSQALTSEYSTMPKLEGPKPGSKRKPNNQAAGNCSSDELPQRKSKRTRKTQPSHDEDDNVSFTSSADADISTGASFNTTASNNLSQILPTIEENESQYDSEGVDMASTEESLKKTNEPTTPNVRARYSGEAAPPTTQRTPSSSFMARIAQKVLPSSLFQRAQTDETTSPQQVEHSPEPFTAPQPTEPVQKPTPSTITKARPYGVITPSQPISNPFHNPHSNIMPLNNRLKHLGNGLYVDEAAPGAEDYDEFNRSMSEEELQGILSEDPQSLREQRKEIKYLAQEALVHVLPQWASQNPEATLPAPQQLWSMLENHSAQELTKAVSATQGSAQPSSEVVVSKHASPRHREENLSGESHQMAPATIEFIPARSSPQNEQILTADQPHLATPAPSQSPWKQPCLPNASIPKVVDAPVAQPPSVEYGPAKTPSRTPHNLMVTTPTPRSSSSKTSKSMASTSTRPSPKTSAFQLGSPSSVSQRKAASELLQPQTPSRNVDKQSGIWNTISKVTSMATSPFKSPFKFMAGAQSASKADAPQQKPEFDFRHSNEVTFPPRITPTKLGLRKVPKHKPTRQMPRKSNKPTTPRSVFFHPSIKEKARHQDPLHMRDSTTTGTAQASQNEDDLDMQDRSIQDEQTHQFGGEKDVLANARKAERTKYQARVEEEDDADDENPNETLAQAGQKTGTKRKRDNRAKTPPRQPAGHFVVPYESSSEEEDSSVSDDDSTPGVTDSPVQNGQSSFANSIALVENSTPKFTPFLKIDVTLPAGQRRLVMEQVMPQYLQRTVRVLRARALKSVEDALKWHTRENQSDDDVRPNQEDYERTRHIGYINPAQLDYLEFFYQSPEMNEQERMHRKFPSEWRQKHGFVGMKESAKNLFFSINPETAPMELVLDEFYPVAVKKANVFSENASATKSATPSYQAPDGSSSEGEGEDGEEESALAPQAPPPKPRPSNATLPAKTPAPASPKPKDLLRYTPKKPSKLSQAWTPPTLSPVVEVEEKGERKKEEEKENWLAGVGGEFRGFSGDVRAALARTEDVQYLS